MKQEMEYGILIVRTEARDPVTERCKMVTLYRAGNFNGITEQQARDLFEQFKGQNPHIKLMYGEFRSFAKIL